MIDDKVTFREVSQLLLALIVTVGVGVMLWNNKISDEMAWAAESTVILFYFGAGNTAASVKAAASAATEAVTRSLEDRGIK